MLSNMRTREACRGRGQGRCLRSLLTKAYDYCTGRGMTYEQIRDYAVSVVLYKPRVYFPTPEGLTDSAGVPLVGGNGS